MKPKSKKGLLKWARNNIGAKAHFQVKRNIYDKQGNLLHSIIIHDAGIREIESANTVEITWEGGSHLRLDQKGDRYEFAETGFKVYPRRFYANLKDGTEVEVEDVMEYTYK